MKINLVKIIKTKANLLYTLLSAIFAYTIPIFGILMDDNWYKWAYILGSHIIGLIICLIIFNWCLDNINQ